MIDSFYEEVHRTFLASMKWQTVMQGLKFLCQICLCVFLVVEHSYLLFNYALR